MMRNIRIKSEHDVKRNICIILYGANILLIVIERRNAHGIQSAHGWSRFPKGVESSLVDGGSGGERSLPLTMGVLGAAWKLPQMVMERPNVSWCIKAQCR